ncbi:MAG: DEAD/DEAH box helicase [Opitutales bacterium]|nr:DEAD/DEAH box helicase [Opitutales bacterium]
MSEPYTPPTKKSFSLKALALWGERLASDPVSDWENLFTEDALYTGRRIYRESKISEIILGAEDAAVIFRVPAATPSSFLQILFDFDENGNIHWRSSSSAPRRESAPFAVAGLYVIEEFVASEYPNLPLSADGEKSAAKENSPEEKKPESAVPVPTRPDRELRLIFSSGENELSFSAEWFDSAGKKESALKTDDAQKILTPGEREQLIRLVAAARKSGFVFKSERDAYVLAGTAQATRFVNEFFPVWQKRFSIEAGLEIGSFSRSVREIDARLRLSAESGNAFGLEWDFSLDGNAFSASEIRTLLKHRGENVFLPGRGIVRLRTSTRTIADDWPDASTHGIPVYTLLSLFRSGENDTLVPDAKLRSWRRNFLKEPETPAGLPEFLRPYQARGVAWIRQMFARGAHPLLADEMGLGKTLQTLALLSLDTTTRRPALIVCPASVIPVWKSEIRKFFPQLSVCVLGADGDFKRRAGKTAAGTKPHIWLSSYGMLRIHAELLPKKRFSCAVLDEAQYIKNPQAKITQVCLKIVADKRLALTGTPIENRHLDLWTVFRFLMPGLLGRRATLENELADPDDAYALEKLKTQIAPFILRRTKQEVARELPEKVQTVLHCPLTPEQRERYEQIVREGLASAPAGESVSQNLSQNPTNLLTLLMRLRQAACDPALLPGQSALPVDFSGKITVLLDRLEEIIDNGGKVVVFSQFVSLLDRAREAIAKRFAGTPVFTLTGKTLDRATPVREFQEREGAGIFLVSLRAGGTGLTLHSAEYVFLLDPWWNPAVEEQAIDRVHRIGQTRRVFVYRMVAAGTIEERIEKLKQSKRAMFDTLVGALPDMSDWASHYPSLESLIALSE